MSSEQEADAYLVAFFCEILSDNLIPESKEEAIKDKQWFKAMQTEYNTLVENNVCLIVDNQ